MLNILSSTARYIRKTADQRDENQSDLPRSGRPRKTRKDEDERLIRSIRRGRDDGWSEILGKSSLSRATIRRRIEEMDPNLKHVRKPLKPRSKQKHATTSAAANKSSLRHSRKTSSRSDATQATNSAMSGVEILVCDATHADASSLSTLVPRSFSSDAFLNKIFPPESEAIRQWWEEVYSNAVDLPNYRVIVAMAGDVAIGVLTLHLWRPEFSSSVGSGICSLVPFTKDHDERMEDIVKSQAETRNSTMGQQANYLVDLMAVDREYQGAGVGKRLLRRACEIADEDKVAIFLQTTEARQYYLQSGLGFVSEDENHEISGCVTRPCSGIN